MQPKENSQDPNFHSEEDLIALYSEKNRTGIALYESNKGTIFATSVVEVESQDYQNLMKFLLLNPFSKIILPHKVSKEFLENLVHIKNNIEKKDDAQEEVEDPIGNDKDESEIGKDFIYYLKKSYFELESCLSTLLVLDFSRIVTEQHGDLANSGADSLDKHAKMKYLRTVLDLENIPMMKALGGLLSFLLQMNLINRSYKIDNIKMKQPQKNVYINMKTYNSLSIFKEQIHPSQIKGKGRSKEGFSLFILYDSMICTSNGRKLLKNWFLNPTYDNSILEDRLYTVEYLLKRMSITDFDKLKKSLIKTYDMATVIRKFQAGTSTKDHWRKVKSTIENFQHVKNQLVSLAESSYSSEKDKSIPTILSKIIGFESEAIKSLSQIFAMCITLKEGSDKIIINSGVSKELDDLRRIYDNLDEILTFYAHQEIAKLPKGKNQKLSLTYMPYFGYMVAIPKDEEEQVSIPEPPSESLSESPSFGRSGRAIYSTETKYLQENTGLSQINELESQDEEEAEQDEYVSNELMPEYQRNDYMNEELPEPFFGQGESEIMINRATSNIFQRKPTSDHSHIIIGQDWEFKFETKESIYFKSDITNYLDGYYGDVGGKIIDIEHEILLELEDEVLDKALELLYLSDLMAELDCHFCFAQVAKQFNFTKPVITNETCFMIKNGRHILSEIAGENQFIPNNYFVYNYIDEYDNAFESNETQMINKNHSNKIVLLSGPNFSGKSIYLKQIGLIVFLCHIGSYVPASLCKIGLVDRILTMIHLTETLNEEGGYTEQMQDLAKIFRLATNKSLVLIDEFGKNASYENGLACCVALIKCLAKDIYKINPQIPMKQLSMLPENDIYYAQKQLFERIPTAIIITHFKEIFLRNLVQEDYLIRFFTMEAMLKNENNHYAFVRSLKYINQDQPQNPYLNYVPMNEAIKVDDLRPENKVLFLYRVKPGYSINSFALFCAKQVGFSPELLKRINEIQNTTLEKVEPNKQIIEKYEQATRDILYRLNDIFISLKNPKIE